MKIVTDALGFPLQVVITLEEIPGRGRHKTYEQEGKVPADAVHQIIINPKLSVDELPEVIAHEVYHLFYSIRHLITVDEETETDCFGQLVKRVHAVWRNSGKILIGKNGEALAGTCQVEKISAAIWWKPWTWGKSKLEIKFPDQFEQCKEIRELSL